MMSQIPEPDLHPLDDTNPSMPIRPVRLVSPEKAVPAWRKAAGWVSLIGALIFTAATILLLMMPAESPTPQPVEFEAETTAPPTEESAPTLTPTTETQPTVPTLIVQSNPLPYAFPTASGDMIANLLLTPIAPLGALSPGQLSGVFYDPFTIAAEGQRSEIVQYTAARGDTIDEIAQRYGLKRETLAWCTQNTRIVQVLLPGDVLTVPPEDGVCHLAIGSATVNDIARRYKIEDPYIIIDSPYNTLSGIAPDTILPSGTLVFVPGGEGPLITWTPEVVEGTDSAGNRTVNFAPGQAGSCGNVSVGGGTFWSNPLPNGTWIRGYYAGHTGLDLAAPEGTPILAANGGPVVYSGWNSWGYGNVVVLAHGPFTTLYGHMSRTGVRCGDFVNAGQVIGYVGSTGNSSGPHLHFEIRFQNQAQDPSGTPGIGW